MEHKAWDIIIVLKQEEASKRGTGRILQKVGLPQPGGQIKSSGLVKVAAQNNHQNHKNENSESNMAQPPKVIDRRVAWLDGVSLEAVEILAKIQHEAINGITLSEHQKNMSELCSGYLYLLKLSKDYGLFDSDDPFNLFEKETLH